MVSFTNLGRIAVATLVMQNPFFVNKLQLRGHFHNNKPPKPSFSLYLKTRRSIPSNLHQYHPTVKISSLTVVQILKLEWLGFDRGLTVENSEIFFALFINKKQKGHLGSSVWPWKKRERKNLDTENLERERERRGIHRIVLCCLCLWFVSFSLSNIYLFFIILFHFCCWELGGWGKGERESLGFSLSSICFLLCFLFF